MLYQIREAQRTILNPVSGWADAMSKLFSNPYSPFSYGPMATRVAAGFSYSLPSRYINSKPAATRVAMGP